MHALTLPSHHISTYNYKGEKLGPAICGIKIMINTSVEKSPSIKVYQFTDPPLKKKNLRSTFVRLSVKWSL